MRVPPFLRSPLLLTACCMLAAGPLLEASIDALLHPRSVGGELEGSLWRGRGAAARGFDYYRVKTWRDRLPPVLVKHLPPGPADRFVVVTLEGGRPVGFPRPEPSPAEAEGRPVELDLGPAPSPFLLEEQVGEHMGERWANLALAPSPPSSAGAAPPSPPH